MARNSLSDELRQTEELWRIWTQRGVSDGSTLSVDFHFYAARAAAGERLAAALRDAGYGVQVNTTRTLLIFKAMRIEATEHGEWTLERLLTRTRELVAVAERLDVLFDGLGAEMPDPASAA